ncbi:MAG: hypothetical protein KBD37_04755 [Burkholderiales bacterium]|nr:hypothetical protein [Burkholderiales bacterium]
MFIVDLHYKVDLAIVDQFVVEHRLWLDKCYAANKLLCSGMKTPRTGGIIIALLTDLDQLNQLLTEDPFSINKVADYTITEFKPSKCHQDFLKLKEI